MSSSCIEDESLGNNLWYRIAQEILSKADIEVNGSRSSDIQVNNPNFFKRVLQEGSLGLGESYMDGWWECERLDIFFSACSTRTLTNSFPVILKIHCVSPLHV